LSGDKGDYVLYLGPHLIECVTKTAMAMNNPKLVHAVDQLEHTFKARTAHVTVSTQGDFGVTKAADGFAVSGAKSFM